MKNRNILSLAALFVLGTLTVSPGRAQVVAVPPLMNFQGRLAKPDGTPVANGTYAVRFSLWNVASGGAAANEKWNQIVNPVNVKNGTFAVLLSGFPAGTFNSDLWLEIKVGADMPLTPRQQLVSVAYAFKANSVPDASIGTAQLAPGAVTTAKIASGAITSALLAPGLLNFWSLLGNAGTNPTTNFLGTTDNQPLEIRVNSVRIARFEPAKTTTDVNGNDWFAPNLIAGNSGNTLASGVVGATIAGGGIKRTLLGTSTFLLNVVTDSGGTVGGGGQNQAGDNAGTVSDAMFATVAGGWLNTASGPSAFIGGGFSNLAKGSSATVSGGQVNQALGNGSAIGGGQNNSVSGVSSVIAGGAQNNSTDNQAVIGGGFHNTNNGYAGVISGGQQNSIGSSLWAVIGGGAVNVANGNYATIPGGYSNTAQGDYSLAAGKQAKALHPGTFVWGDNSVSTDFTSTGDNQFLIRAAGGVGINTSAPIAPLHVEGSSSVNGSVVLHSPKGVNFSHIHYGPRGDWYIRSASSDGDVILQDSGSNAWVGVGLTPSYKLDVNGTLRCTGFINTSDARYKQNIATFPNALEAVLNLRGVTFDWNRDAYQDMNFSAGKQIGFIAQEVEKVLPELVSTDRKGYKSVAYANIVPVLVEAVKTLNAEVNEKQKQINALTAKIERLFAIEKENADIKKQLNVILAALKQLQGERSK